MSERANQTGEEKINHLTDELIAVVEDYRRRHAWDSEAARVQMRRIIRDSCAELWEESAVEVDCERFRTERDGWQRAWWHLVAQFISARGEIAKLRFALGCTTVGHDRRTEEIIERSKASGGVE